MASRWPVVVPPVGAVLLGAAFLLPLHPILAAACALALFACVTAAVHHAEVVAHRVGEPFGTLVLALAISGIEVALVLSLTLAGGPEKAALARDTVFATVMIICNGVIGLCVLLGAWRHREQSFRIEGFGPGVRRPRGARDARPRSPRLHDERLGAEVHARSSSSRGGVVPRPLGGFRLLPDRSAPRLLPAAGRSLRRGRARRAARRAPRREQASSSSSSRSSPSSAWRRRSHRTSRPGSPAPAPRPPSSESSSRSSSSSPRRWPPSGRRARTACRRA